MNDKGFVFSGISLLLLVPVLLLTASLIDMTATGTDIFTNPTKGDKAYFVYHNLYDPSPDYDGELEKILDYVAKEIDPLVEPDEFRAKVINETRKLSKLYLQNEGVSIDFSVNASTPDQDSTGTFIEYSYIHIKSGNTRVEKNNLKIYVRIRTAVTPPPVEEVAHCPTSVTISVDCKESCPGNKYSNDITARVWNSTGLMDASVTISIIGPGPDIINDPMTRVATGIYVYNTTCRKTGTHTITVTATCIDDPSIAITGNMTYNPEDPALPWC
ncbi:MAG: hypothetical protein ACE5K4_01265 [Candidatus Hydrothermarchaeota archaeon]